MTYKGKVRNGVVVLETGTDLEEGVDVIVQPVADRDDFSSLREGLLKFAGAAKGLPSDMARNHDHYIHGTPKK